MSVSFGQACLHINKSMSENTLEHGAVARLRLDEPIGHEPKLEETKKTIILPLGDNRKVKLATGYWSISIDLPSGEILQDDFVIEKEKTTNINLEIEQPLYHNLAIHHYSGAIADNKTLRKRFNQQIKVNIDIDKGDTIEEKKNVDAEYSSSLLRLKNRHMAFVDIDEIQLSKNSKKRTSFSLLSKHFDDKVVKMTRFEQPFDSFNWSNLLNLNEPKWQQVFKKMNVTSERSLYFKNTIYEVLNIRGDGYSNNKRAWAHISGFGENRLISIPAPWKHKYGVKSDSEFEILISLLKSEHGLAQLLVKNTDTAAMLAYMTNHRLLEAEIIAREAKSWLFEKMQNPIAAAGGGYIMLATSLHKKNQSWPQWIKNLAEWFPHIPDGKVLEGYMYLNGPKNIRNFDKAAECFNDAYNRGMPYYSLGLTWLSSGLMILASQYPELAKHGEVINRISRMIETNHTFTTLRLPQTHTSGN